MWHREARPKRIVSTALNIDEYLYQIVPPEHVVGVSRFAYDVTFSAVLEHTETYRPVVTSDKDAILSARPDLVITTDSIPSDVMESLIAAGISVFRLWISATQLEQVADNITVVGYLTGQDEPAQRNANALSARSRKSRRNVETPRAHPLESMASRCKVSPSAITRYLRTLSTAAEPSMLPLKTAFTPTTKSRRSRSRAQPGLGVYAGPRQARNHQAELRRWMEDPHSSKPHGREGQPC